MNWGALAKLFGFFSCIIAALIGCSALVCLLMDEPEAWRLGLSALIPLVGGVALMQISWHEDIEDLSHREACLLIAFTWPLAIFWGAYPYLFSGIFGDYSFGAYLNSLFESTAGFTATASSVVLPMVDFEKLCHGLLFWRSLSQWLGGLGIILIALLFLPFIHSGGMELFQTGSIARDRLRTRAGETPKLVVWIYIGLTVFCFGALKLAGMDFFDAICHAFTTVSAGGFSTHNGNIAYYYSSPVEIILILFMLLSTTNFVLHFSFARGEWGAYFRSAEFRFYIFLLSLAVGLIYWNLRVSGVPATLQSVIFNTVSSGSTTGFWTTDVSLWPSFSRAFLLLLMFTGGMVGSTAGGIKCFRIIILFRYAYRQVFRIIHPSGFTPVKVEKRVVEREVLEGLTAFFFIYITIFGIGSMILQACGYEMLVAASAAASALGGVGPGFGQMGADGGFFNVPMAGKITLMSLMLLGRVEIFPILVILSKEFWRK
ncbi:MAG: TrkH family potassium uptake protein [Deltaproteobacteria bacterium]|nr:TrkH family potassium uptake protein [Deltaproteobacteria bacterium]